MRGDATDEAIFRRAAATARALGVDAEADAGPLFDAPPRDIDAEVLKRLRQMYEAGGWVLVESALADLPADLRWLYESGAVTIDELVRGISIALGEMPIDVCRAMDTSGDGQIQVHEVVEAVTVALNGC